MENPDRDKYRNLDQGFLNFAKSADDTYPLITFHMDPDWIKTRRQGFAYILRRLDADLYPPAVEIPFFEEKYAQYHEDDLDKIETDEAKSMIMAQKIGIPDNIISLHVLNLHKSSHGQEVLQSKKWHKNWNGVWIHIGNDAQKSMGNELRYKKINNIYTLARNIPADKFYEDHACHIMEEPQFKCGLILSSHSGLAQKNKCFIFDLHKKCKNKKTLLIGPNCDIWIPLSGNHCGQPLLNPTSFDVVAEDDNPDEWYTCPKIIPNPLNDYKLYEHQLQTIYHYLTERYFNYAQLNSNTERFLSVSDHTPNIYKNREMPSWTTTARRKK
ncbi:hypothetical protein [Govanella unica]|uniref:Uncharacterized protein n=1 Tax=Govanella unica TaxID=2975056 RepID=A0A9X3TX16_9PROT|nr:hypothetical protein [Govania unica]MDA5193565.1 hypothetical protein [Govania unica]